MAPPPVPLFHQPNGGLDGGLESSVRHQALTQMQAKNAPVGKHADGQGLWLVKRDRRFGKWVLRLFVVGKRREMGLGSFPEVSIGEARQKALETRKKLRDGADPIFERKKAKTASKRLTLKEAIDGCFEARKAELKNDGDAGRWMSPLSVHVIPKIGTYPIEGIDQHILRETFAPIWHTKPESAEKALNRLSLTFKHAAALGLSVDLQATMKARALLGKQRRSVTHIPSLPYADAPAFYRWLIEQDGTSALALIPNLRALFVFTEERRLETARRHFGAMAQAGRVVVKVAPDFSRWRWKAPRALSSDLLDGMC